MYALQKLYRGLQQAFKGYSSVEYKDRKERLNMLEVGKRVFHKNRNKKGTIVDAWNPHCVNPAVYPVDSPTGYKIVTDDGIHHICTKEEFHLLV